MDVRYLVDSLRQSIFESNDIPTQDVVMENWNGVTLRVMGMSAQQQYEVLQASIDQETKVVNFAKMYPNIVIACTHAILEDGKTGPCVFEQTDKELLASKAAINIEKLAKAAMILSGMSDAGLDTENSK